VAAKKVAAKKSSAAEKITSKASSAKVAASKTVATSKASESKASSAKVAAPKTAAELKKMEPGLLLAYTVAQGMYERKAENIRIMDMRKIHSASADFFVVCHADNDKKVEAIAKSAEEEVKKRLNENPLHREGFENLEWILLDYFNVVAHVFIDEKRTFYGIEQLWGDAENIEFKGK
jgi:ribosome-associated protein